MSSSSGVTGAGKFIHRVTLMQRDGAAPTVNELGEQVHTPASLGPVWARVSPVKSEELNENAEHTLIITHQVTLRYNGTLTHNDWILYGQRVLYIVDITDPDEETRETVLSCREQTA